MHFQEHLLAGSPLAYALAFLGAVPLWRRARALGSAAVAALAATLITYRPKSAVRDVGKALGLDLAQVDERPLGLRDDLLGDDDDVIRAQGQGAGRRRDGVGHELRHGGIGRRRGGDDAARQRRCPPR